MCGQIVKPQLSENKLLPFLMCTTIKVVRQDWNAKDEIASLIIAALGLCQVCIVFSFCAEDNGEMYTLEQRGEKYYINEKDAVPF